MKTHVRQSGLTLIELMIAMLVGLFLLTGIVMVFINSNKSNHMQENLSRLQENARFALEFLSRDLRMVGYWDCMKPTSPNNDLTGTEGASGAPDSITVRAAFDHPKSNTDVCGTPLFNSVPIPPTVACSAADNSGDIYTDINSIVTYSIHKDETNPQDIKYFLRRSNGALTDDTCAVKNVNDVVEDIEDLQILYGVDDPATDNIPNRYLEADEVADWPNVKSVRITITVRSQDDNLWEKSADNPDGRIRQFFTTTIALRNRMIK